MTAVFKLFTNIKPVRGATRSTLCDLQRGRIKLIPNELFDILTLQKDLPLEAILAEHQTEDHAVIQDYFRFLIAEEWGFMCEDPTRFPSIDLDYAAPHHIRNAIIDVDRHSTHHFPELCQHLEDLGCRGLQIRVFDAMSWDWLIAVLTAFATSRLRNIDLWLPENTDWADDALLQLIRQHPRVYRLVLHGAQTQAVTASGMSKTMGLLVRIPQRMDSEHHCGQVDRSYFTSELYTFAEATQWNSCLNRKISVDKRGFLRNCPSMPTHFGQADERSWRDVIASDVFRETWAITKDQVAVCQDCEFRYVCTDCRAYTADDHPLGKPAKCHYDPYTAQWQDQHMPAVMPV